MKKTIIIGLASSLVLATPATAIAAEQVGSQTGNRGEVIQFEGRKPAASTVSVTPIPALISRALDIPQEEIDAELVLDLTQQIDEFLSTANGSAKSIFEYNIKEIDFAGGWKGEWVTHDGVTWLSDYDGKQVSIFTPKGRYVQALPASSVESTDSVLSPLREMYPVNRKKKILWGIERYMTDCTIYCSNVSERLEGVETLASVTKTQIGTTTTIDAAFNENGAKIKIRVDTASGEFLLDATSNQENMNQTVRRAVEASMTETDPVSMPARGTVASQAASDIADSIWSAASGLFRSAFGIEYGKQPSEADLRKFAGRKVQDQSNMYTFSIPKAPRKDKGWLITAKSDFDSKPFRFVFMPSAKEAEMFRSASF